MSHIPTIDQLRSLRLNGMADALSHQLSTSVYSDLGFEQRIQMLVESELSHRDTQRYDRIMKNAKLKVVAAPEHFDFRAGRGLDKSVVAYLLTCSWINNSRNVLLTGPTGTGKTWVACALAVQAARYGHTVMYRRTARLLEELAIAHEDGSISKLRNALARTKLLILDDFGLVALTPRGRADLLEVLDDRVSTGSTIVAGQMPVKEWHAFINDPALADAILDRLIYSSVKLELHGESMRKLKARSAQ